MPVAIAPAWAPVALTPRGVAAARLSEFQDAWTELTPEDRAADGRTWRHVRDPADRSEGWVASEFLAPATGAASPTPTG